MANLTTSDNLQIPRVSKRRNTFGDGEKDSFSNGHVSQPVAPHKRSRILVDESSAIEDPNSFQSSQLPASQDHLGSSIYGGLPRVATPFKDDGSDRIDEFLERYEMSTQTPNKFVVVLKYLPDEHRESLKELGLDDGEYVGAGHRLRVNWSQFGRLMTLKLLKEVEEFPDNFWQVLAKADEGQGGDTGS